MLLSLISALGGGTLKYFFITDQDYRASKRGQVRRQGENQVHFISFAREETYACPSLNVPMLLSMPQAEMFRGAAGQYRLLATRLEQKIREVGERHFFPSSFFVRCTSFLSLPDSLFTLTHVRHIPPSHSARTAHSTSNTS